MSKDTGNNKWGIYPLSAFQEASVMFNIGKLKKDSTVTKEALDILTKVTFSIAIGT